MKPPLRVQLMMMYITTFELKSLKQPSADDSVDMRVRASSNEDT